MSDEKFRGADGRSFSTGLKRAHSLFGRLVADIDRRLAHRSGPPTARRILIALAHAENVTDAQLATHLGLERSHASRVVAKLIKDQLVTSSPNPSHKTQRLLRLTEQGCTKAQELDKSWIFELKNQYDRLNPLEQRLVLSAAGNRLENPSEIGLLFDVQYCDLEARDSVSVLRLGFERRPNDNLHIAAVAQSIAQYLRDDNFARYGAIARYGNTVIGSSLLLPRAENDLHAALSCVFVSADFASKGVERQLLTMCLAHARRNKLVGVSITAWADDSTRDDLLRELGFSRHRQKREAIRSGKASAFRTYEIRFEY